MKTKFLALAIACGMASLPAIADSTSDKNNESAPSNESKLIFGGYGEAAISRNFYSDNYLRYSSAEKYKDTPSHGRFDLPHVVFFVGYNFGKGWSIGSEIEFEHGGTESAIEIEQEEAGEYEQEVERGGEVALEQFWIQKSFNTAFNLKMGHFIVPVGLTNQHHMPTEFFGVYRPEGENTIIPCTWHETGISLWGKIKDWRYEVQFLAGLDADRFGNKGWIHDGAGSPYEFKIANAYAGAARIDNYSVPGLRIGISGYIGNSFKNTLSSISQKNTYKDITGTVSIGAVDFHYDAHNWIVRGGAIYGHLSNSALISKFNMNQSQNSPSPAQHIGSDAISVGVEAGYDFFSQIDKLKDKGQKLYLFGRYDYYDSMFKTAPEIIDLKWCGRQRLAAGLNYFPIKNVVIKGEYAIGLLDKQYNNEPSLSFGVAYSGFFTR